MAQKNYHALYIAEQAKLNTMAADLHTHRQHLTEHLQEYPPEPGNPTCYQFTVNCLELTHFAFVGVPGLIPVTETKVIQQLEQSYWLEESRLARLADSLGVTRKYLCDNPEQFPNHRDDLATILWNQVEILERLLKLKRSEVSRAPVVSLNKYRKLVQSK